ncbi:MAG: class I SAM-dependent methyltransferase [Coriobacteriia bacterium]|nr:class I SAM-dependent methyltransferase [Coriobacteriia bacterium]
MGENTRPANDIAARNIERFGARAAGYRTSATHCSGRDLELLVEQVAPRPGERALDVATGAGHVALSLARAGARVTVTDLTPAMLKEARAHLESEGVAARYEIADATALPFPDAYFAVVTCRIAAHHFSDAQMFFAEVERVLRPGGRLGFQDQSLPPEGTSAVMIDAFERLRDPSHNQSYNAAAWATLAERAGLEVTFTELVDKRHDFTEWTAIQDCPTETVRKLEALMAECPSAMREWSAPEYDDGTLMAFRNRHLVMLARKPD